jgi:hypothetical protein
MPNFGELIEKYGGELGRVLPLLLLFAFWWIFSMLGSRFKKNGEKPEEADSQGLQGRILQMMTGGQDDNVDPKVAKPSDESRTVIGPEQTGGYYQGPLGPTDELEPKPINPRWWRA